MVKPEKISTLMAVIAMVASLACKVGLWVLGKKRIRKKEHGRPARLLFAFGLEKSLRKLFSSRTFVQSLQVILAFLFEKPKKIKALLCI